MKYIVEKCVGILKPMCNATLSTYIDEEMLQDSWEMIERITSLYPGSDVSGGIISQANTVDHIPDPKRNCFQTIISESQTIQNHDRLLRCVSSSTYKYDPFSTTIRDLINARLDGL